MGRSDTTTAWIDNLIPGEDESHLKPCQVLMGDHRLNMLAKDYESAMLGVEAWCGESNVERQSALNVMGDAAIRNGWERP